VGYPTDRTTLEAIVHKVVEELGMTPGFRLDADRAIAALRVVRFLNSKVREMLSQDDRVYSLAWQEQDEEDLVKALRVIIGGSNPQQGSAHDQINQAFANGRNVLFMAAAGRTQLVITSA